MNDEPQFEPEFSTEANLDAPGSSTDQYVPSASLNSRI
jgi:hypothetical protein